ncbi:MAG: hypothetical protein VYE22_25455 [Myxococcota bacterium]|nr:hypothetical protein [Myxococcota bacterium]
MTKTRVEIRCPKCFRQYSLELDLEKLKRLRRRAQCGRCGESFDVGERLAAERAGVEAGRTSRRPTRRPPPGDDGPRRTSADEWRPVPTPIERRSDAALDAFREASTRPPPAPAAETPSEPPVELSDDDLLSLAPPPPPPAPPAPSWGELATVDLAALQTDEPPEVEALMLLIGEA